jgi:hypothetical protein
MIIFQMKPQTCEQHYRGSMRLETSKPYEVITKLFQIICTTWANHFVSVAHTYT